MSLADVERIALKLSEADRGLLAATLFDSVASDALDHSPDEFERREREMDQGNVSEIGHEELLKRIEAERRR